VGVAIVLAIACSLTVAARAIRRKLMPEWRGSAAYLAETVIGFALLIWLSQLLGTLGWFGTIPLLVGCIGVGAAGWLLSSNERPERVPTDSDTGHAASADGSAPEHPVVVGLALLAVAAIGLAWIGGTARSFDQGMVNLDSIWYHLPFAANFVDSGSLTDFVFIQADPLSSAAEHDPSLAPPAGVPTFYPANSSVLHATGMLAFDRDLASPLLNLLFCGLVLLTAWVLGARFGARWPALAAAALALSVPALADTQAGEATNDVVGLFFVMASIAIATRAGSELSSLVVAGLAAGLAVGTKPSFALLALVLTFAVIFLAKGRRWLATLAWGIPLVLGGGFWYARNLLLAGTPMPTVDIGIGPISLPSADAPTLGRVDQTVAQYLTDSDVWRSYFHPGLAVGLGSLWRAIVALALAGAVLAVVSRRERALRMLGLGAIGFLISYTITPQTAGGPDGPVLFLFNLRFVAPGLMLGLVLLACLPAFGRFRPRVALVALLAALAVLTAADTAEWPTRAGPLTLLLVAVVLVFARYASPAAMHPVASRASVALGVSLAAVALIAAGWRVQDSYLTSRYEDSTLAASYRWASSQREATIGIEGFVQQYPLWGPDLSNPVEYIGVEGSHGTYQPASDCREWRRLVNAGGYDYVITAPYYFPFDHDAPEPIEEDWTRSAAAIEVVPAAEPMSIFRIDGRLDPASCSRGRG
jgi:hypothetical protein